MNISVTNKHKDSHTDSRRRYLRIYSVLAISILITAICSGQDKIKKIDWVVENLSGKVKTVKQTCYSAINKSGEIIKGGRIDNSLKENYSPPDFDNTYSIYNQSGYTEVKCDYNAHDSLLGKSNYKYDSNWNLVEVNNYDSNNVLIANSTYKYDDKGNEIEAKSSSGSGVVYYKDISKYDDKGNQIEMIIFDMDKPPSKNIFKYDDKGNPVEMKRYDSDGRYDSKIIYDYDDKGHVVEYNVYDPDGNVIGVKETYKYDDLGNLVENNTYDPDGSLIRKWAYKLDIRGNLAEWSFYKSDGTLDGKISYNYKYDAKGNWVMKICLINEKPECIYEREIEYYE